MSTGSPRFISLNGPDNVGKTTQMRRLAAWNASFQPLGSVHEHDPALWQEANRGDYAQWWFERVSIEQLIRMFSASHAKRSTALHQGRTGLLDRGWPMLTAVSAATSAVRQRLGPAKAYGAVVEQMAAAGFRREPEIALLLLPSMDGNRSVALGQGREGRPWTGIYPAYQRMLHKILLHQAESGSYDEVIDCEGLDESVVHRRVLDSLRSLDLPPTPDNEEP